jgi:hypothetical protein
MSQAATVSKREAVSSLCTLRSPAPILRYRTQVTSALAENDPGTLAKADPPLHHDGAIAQKKNDMDLRRVGPLPTWN